MNNIEYQECLVQVDTKKTVIGPTIIIQNTCNQILIVFEAEQKDWKRKGQIFIPAGAKEKSDNDMISAAVREIKEETGLENINHLLLEKKGEIFLEGQKNNINAHVYLYKEKIHTDALKNIKHSHSHEITDKVFMDIKKILSLRRDLIRPGLYEILATGLLSKKIDYTVNFDGGIYDKYDKSVENTYQELLKTYKI